MIGKVLGLPNILRSQRACYIQLKGPWKPISMPDHLLVNGIKTFYTIPFTKYTASGRESYLRGARSTQGAPLELPSIYFYYHLS